MKRALEENGEKVSSMSFSLVVDYGGITRLSKPDWRTKPDSWYKDGFGNVCIILRLSILAQKEIGYPF